MKYMNKILLLLAVTILFATASLYVGQQLIVSTPNESITSVELVENEAIAMAAETTPAIPIRLVIPSIDVDAFVESVGVTSDGTGQMAVPSTFIDVGWYKHGVRPGMDGSAVIAGHLNGRNTPQAVFYDLHTLEIGDKVHIVNAEQIEETFVVVKVETYAHDAPTTDVFVSADGKARLNLITCGGDWLEAEDVYSTRTVVFTERLIASE